MAGVTPSRAQEPLVPLQAMPPRARIGVQAAVSQALLGSEVFEGRSPVLAGQVLMKLLPQSLQAVPVAGAQAELGDVKAGGVRHVDHKGIGQDQQLVLLQEGKKMPAGSGPFATTHPGFWGQKGAAFWGEAYLGIKLHDVGHLVPAKAYEPLVIEGAVTPYYNIRLKVGLPSHLVWHCGCPPLGIVCWGMALWPHVVPVHKDNRRGEEILYRGETISVLRQAVLCSEN